MLQTYYHEEKQQEIKRKEKEQELLEGKRRTRAAAERVTIEGMDDLLVRFAKCCNPVPGDEIIGFITKGRGISIHRKDCINILSLPEEDKQRFIKAEWNRKKGNVSYDVDVQLLAEDRKGLLSDISRVCEDMDADCRPEREERKGQHSKHHYDIIPYGHWPIEKVLQKFRTVSGLWTPIEQTCRNNLTHFIA